MKSNTQNTKIEAVTEKTLVVGIDVGSEFHYARAFDWRGIEFSKKPFKFSNTEPGFIEFKAWILHIQTEHDKDAVVPGMEPTGHYWFNLGKFLQDNGMKPVLVNPHHVKKSKELDDNNLDQGWTLFVPLPAGRRLRGPEDSIKSSVPDAVRTYENTKPDQSLVQHLFSRI